MRRTWFVTVLVYAAILAAAGDVITTYRAQSMGRGEATAWLAHLFMRYPIGIGLLALFAVRAFLVLLGAASTTGRSYVSRVFGFAWLVELGVFGWLVVAHNLVIG